MANFQRSHTSIFSEINMGGKAQDLQFAFQNQLKQPLRDKTI